MVESHASLEESQSLQPNARGASFLIAREDSAHSLNEYPVSLWPRQTSTSLCETYTALREIADPYYAEDAACLLTEYKGQPRTQLYRLQRMPRGSIGTPSDQQSLKCQKRRVSTRVASSWPRVNSTCWLERPLFRREHTQATLRRRVGDCTASALFATDRGLGRCLYRHSGSGNRPPLARRHRSRPNAAYFACAWRPQSPTESVC